MKTIIHREQQFTLREVQEADIPALRVLVNEAYKELADMGLNYTATYQDEQRTRERLQKGVGFVLCQQQAIVATILFWSENHFTERKTGYVGQFAVSPKLKKSGLGTILLNHCEQLAREQKFVGIQLDTAKPAVHLVNWYLKLGYKIVGEIQWEGKTYDSFIFEKVF